MARKVLIIDDDALLASSLKLLLKREDYEIMICGTARHGIDTFEKNRPDVVLLDVKLEDMDGIEVLRHIKENSPATPVIMITAYGTIENSVNAMREGAFDYIQKPFENKKVKALVKKAFDFKPIDESLIAERRQYIEDHRLLEGVCESEAMKGLFETIEGLGKSSDTRALIEGESGTGKEWAAKYVHFLSPRYEKVFVKLNCACIPEPLAESELFGYEPGAFSGGVKNGKPGIFEIADGGTLLLDEISDLSAGIQGKLLRVLEEGTYFRLGGTREVQCNVRIIAATNRNLLSEVDKGTFREDLYYRLSVFRIYIPPLRERKDDILPLAGYFLRQYCSKYGKSLPQLSPQAEQLLKDFPWRGNVRELRNVMERVALMEDSSTIRQCHLRFLGEGMETSAAGAAQKALDEKLGAADLNLENRIKGMISKALDQSGGNQVQAARLLGISRAKLRYQMKRYDLLK